MAAAGPSQHATPVGGRSLAVAPAYGTKKCGSCWEQKLISRRAPGTENVDGVYSGKRTLVKGSEPNCPAEETVSATIQDHTLTFSDSTKRKYTIGFYPDPDGAFHEIHTDEGGASVDIRGRIFGEIIEVDVTNPLCEHHWHQKKEQPVTHPGIPEPLGLTAAAIIRFTSPETARR